jgi:tetratricopeptide (TPR) repeat protein
MSLVPKWWLSSIQHAIDSREKDRRQNRDNTENENTNNEDKSRQWVALYGKGDIAKAETLLVEEIGKSPARHYQARIYNDLGYIRSGQSGETVILAYKDLESALDLHPSQLQLTLLNLSYLDIKNENYDRAIERIEAALFLSLSPSEINAAYLRLCVPEYKLGFRNYWEQHPANVIEASYVNLAYALLRIQQNQEAMETLKEGLEIMPASKNLQHALARFYLYNKDARSAYAIYRKFSESTEHLNDALMREVRYFENLGRRSKRKFTKKKRR